MSGEERGRERNGGMEGERDGYLLSFLFPLRACLELSSSVASTLCIKRTSCLLLGQSRGLEGRGEGEGGLKGANC